MALPDYHTDTWGNRTSYSRGEQHITAENFHLTPAFSGIYGNPSPFPYFERSRGNVLKRFFLMLLQIHRFRVQFKWNSAAPIFKEIKEYFPACEKKPRWWMPLHVQYEGKKFNGVIMKNAEVLMNIERHVPRGNFQRVCEIGGGYGAMAEMVIKRFHPEYYYIIDLPETLRISRLYLTSVFPERIDKSIIFVSAGEYENIQVPFSLFINVNSFAEMPLEVVRRYFAFMERSVGAYLGATNPPRFEGDYLYAGPETYPYNEQWEILWKQRQRLYYYRKNYQIIARVRA